MDSERTHLIEIFLQQHAWDKAKLTWLNQDASTRSYARLLMQDGRTALLMNSPPQVEPPCPPNATDSERQSLGWYATARLAASRVDAFVVIASLLREQGLSTPQIYAHNIEHGLCLLEDFGAHKELAEHLSHTPQDETPLYTRAIEVLAHIHLSLPKTRMTLKQEALTWPLLEFDTLAAHASMDVLHDWYGAYSDGRPAPIEAWETARNALVEKAMAQPRCFCFRDFHSQNLLWLPERKGLTQIGLLDFQDAIIGWDVWDLDLLLRDARREISDTTRTLLLARYCELTGQNMSQLSERWAIIGTLNAIRIIGVFARLIKRDGRTEYTQYMPQQIAHLRAHLAHESVADFREFITEYYQELIG